MAAPAQSWRQKLSDLFPFLAEFAAAERRWFTENGHFAAHRQGEVLLSEGFSCEYISFVLEGCIRVFKLSADGREVTLYRIYPGDTCLIAVNCMLDAKPFPAVAEAETDTALLRVDSASFQRFLARSPAFQRYVLNASLRRLGAVVEVLDVMAFSRRRQALAAWLLDRWRSAQTREVVVTHRQLAVELGTAREVVSRTLKELERDGMLRTGRGKIRILAPDALALEVSD